MVVLFYRSAHLCVFRRLELLTRKALAFICRKVYKL